MTVRRKLLTGMCIFVVVGSVVGGVTYAYRDYLLEDSYIEDLRTGDWMSQGIAARRLGGIRSGKAVPALIEALKGNDVRRSVQSARAETTLGQMRENVRDSISFFESQGEFHEDNPGRVMIESMFEPEVMVRTSIIFALDEIGDQALEAVPAIVEKLRDSHAVVRMAAAKALGSVRGDPGVAVPALVVSLSDSAEPVRRHATMALGEYGPAAEAAIPQLEAIVKDDPDRNLQRIAAESLVNLRADLP